MYIVFIVFIIAFVMTFVLHRLCSTVFVFIATMFLVCGRFDWQSIFDKKETSIHMRVINVVELKSYEFWLS